MSLPFRYETVCLSNSPYIICRDAIDSVAPIFVDSLFSRAFFDVLVGPSDSMFSGSKIIVVKCVSSSVFCWADMLCVLINKEPIDSLVFCWFNLQCCCVLQIV
jgi:hypothetical protein